MKQVNHLEKEIVGVKFMITGSEIMRIDRDGKVECVKNQKDSFSIKKKGIFVSQNNVKFFTPRQIPNFDAFLLALK